MKRRNFLITSMLSLPVANSYANSPDGKKEPVWDAETDVVIIGCGGAGACAAIEAKDNGADVIVLEKAPFGGGATLASGGGITIPKDSAKAAQFFPKVFEFSNNEFDPKLLEVFIAEIGKQKDWLLGLLDGMKPVPYRGSRYKMLPGSDTIEKMTFRGNNLRSGEAFWAILDNGMKTRGIKILYDTPAIHLVKDNGEIIGVEAVKNDHPYFVKARKAVVLTTGGYENSPELLTNLAQGKDILNMGTPYSTGDGIKMAKEAGAELWHTSAYSCALGAKIPGKVGAMIVNIPTSGIWVDHNGRRFCNEKGIDLHAALYMVNLYDSSKLTYPRIPTLLIFDKKAFDEKQYAFRVREGAELAAAMGWIGRKEGFNWSKDGQWELDKGVIRKYGSLSDLAKAEHIDLSNLQDTIRVWNDDVSKGKDTQYGREVRRGDKNISLPLVGEEFYVMSLYPALFNTQGGPKHNSKSQVISVTGKPIPRLYAAGELGSMWGNLYEGGCNISECVVFGRIAGKNAAQEKAGQ